MESLGVTSRANVLLVRVFTRICIGDRYNRFNPISSDSKSDSFGLNPLLLDLRRAVKEGIGPEAAMARAPIHLLLLLLCVCRSFCYLLHPQLHLSSLLKSSSCINTVSPSFRPRARALVARRDLAGKSIRMAISEEEVEKFLRVVEEGKEAKAPTKIFKAMKKASGAMSVAVEFSRHPNADEGALHGVEFRQFSLKMRREKASVILVDGSSKSGLEDCQKFVEEQVKPARRLSPALT
eukprot:245057-Hanusia_phi.AAC.1